MKHAPVINERCLNEKKQHVKLDINNTHMLIFSLRNDTTAICLFGLFVKHFRLLGKVITSLD